MSAEDRVGIWIETGGDLGKDRTLFRFGKRVETVLLTNGTDAARKFDVQVARDPVFYWPASSFAPSNNREIRQETYFYWQVPANSTAATPPFYARRGLKVKAQTVSCSAHAIVYGVEEGECTVKGLS